MKRIQSTCNFCAIDCNLDFCVENGRIVRTIPTKGYPVNDGFSCIKGLSLSKQQTTVKPDALPKIRQADGTMKEVSWEEGFQHVADKLKELMLQISSRNFRQNMERRALPESVPVSLPLRSSLFSAMS